MSEIDTNRKSERRPDRAALAIAALLLLGAAIVAWDASRLGGAAQYARIGPQTIPYVIAICLAGLGFWTIIEALRGDFPEREPQEARPVLWIVAGLLLQLLTIRFIGFSLATGIILSVFVWLVFARGLSLTLPHGPLEDALSQALQAIIALFRPAAGAA